MATLAELLRNPNPQTNEEGSVYLGDESSGRWVGQNEYNNLKSMESLIPNATYLNSYANWNGDNATYTANYKLPDGGTITYDVASNKPLSYEPPMSWYDEQLKARPDALRSTDYRNQTYLATGPLQQTYNFNGTEVPMTLSEWQVDKNTGQFVKGPTGENKAVEWRPTGSEWIDDWRAPVAVMAIPALAAGGAYLAGAYGAGTAAGGAAAGTAAGGTAAGTTGALTTTELLGGAGGAFAPTAGSGASFAVPAGAYTAAGAGAMGPTYAEMGYTGLGEGMAGPTYGEMGYTGLNQSEAIAQADAAAKAGSGLNNYQKAQLIRSGANALNSAFNNSSQIGGGNTGGSSGYNYTSMPWLANPQYNQVFMKTGPDVSGSGITTAGMPVQLDTTRHNILMANLLRG